MRYRFRIVLLVSIIALAAINLHAQVLARWQIGVVDASRGTGASVFSSLAIDRFGNLQLAYSSRGGSELRYAFEGKGDNRWNTSLVDSTGGVSDSLVVDAAGHAHIAYSSPRLPGLFYAVWDGQRWEKTLIDPAKVGHQISMLLDGQGHPRIAYYLEQFSEGQEAHDLKYAYSDGRNWYIQTVDHRSGTGRWNSLALDHNDHPYISYSMTTPGNLALAHLGQEGWEHSVADLRNIKDAHYLDGANSLVLDKDDQPHIAYVDLVARTVNYLWRKDSDWHQETVDSPLTAGSDADQISLKLDQNLTPHMVFYDAGLGALKYATREAQAWRMETVDSDNAGEYASLCLDPQGNPYISYSAPVDKEIRVAYKLLVGPKQSLAHNPRLDLR